MSSKSLTDTAGCKQQIGKNNRLHIKAKTHGEADSSPFGLPVDPRDLMAAGALGQVERKDVLQVRVGPAAGQRGLQLAERGLG